MRYEELAKEEFSAFESKRLISLQYKFLLKLWFLSCEDPEIKESFGFRPKDWSFEFSD